jgi:NCAIR mutase (PurE)-related protein
MEAYKFLNLREILKKVKDGELSINEAEKLLKLLAIQEIGEAAKLDEGRELRRSIPEIIYAESKQEKYLIQIVSQAIQRRDKVILSKLKPEIAESIKASLTEEALSIYYNEEAKIMVIKKLEAYKPYVKRKIGVVTAGTSDIPIALEAKITAEEMGCEVLTAFDVGIAGIHRLFKPLKNMIEQNVDAIIVVAGMEGALPSLVASLVDAPVIGVPTSIGYGVGERGLGALITMLQSCTLGLSVVNIDGGVAAGVFASLIAYRAAKAKEESSN